MPDNMQLAVYHHEQLIFRIVVMPHELAFELHEFYLKIVYFAHNLRAVVITEAGEFLSNIDCVHKCLTPSAGSTAQKTCRPVRQNHLNKRSIRQKRGFENAGV